MKKYQFLLMARLINVRRLYSFQFAQMCNAVIAEGFHGTHDIKLIGVSAK